MNALLAVEAVIAVIAAVGGFLVGKYRGLQLERNRARRNAAMLNRAHPTYGRDFKVIKGGDR